MFDTHLYQTQHKKLLSILDELKALLADSNVALNASRARSLLSQLAAALTVHLYLEDKELYPAILNDPDPAVRAKASAFLEEMGNLMAAFKLFIGEYYSTEQILAEPLTFVQDTQAILQALTQRISAEETDLFVLLEGYSYDPRG